MFSCGFPGCDHSFVNLVGEDRTIVWPPIIVLTGGDIAARPGCIDLEDTRFVRLTPFTSNAGEITCHVAVAPITHGMDGKHAQGTHGGTLIPETKSSQLLIDEPIVAVGLRPFSAAHAAAIKANFTVGVHEAAIGDQPLDCRLPGANVGDRARLSQRRAESCCGGLHGFLVELEVEDFSLSTMLFENPLSFEVGQWHIVLMDGGDEDASAVSPRGLGQDIAPAIVRIIADLAPID